MDREWGGRPSPTRGPRKCTRSPLTARQCHSMSAPALRGRLAWGTRHVRGSASAAPLPSLLWVPSQDPHCLSQRPQEASIEPSRWSACPCLWVSGAPTMETSKTFLQGPPNLKNSSRALTQGVRESGEWGTGGERPDQSCFPRTFLPWLLPYFVSELQKPG